MRKKYLSALLFGALLFASAGTFTSCKDYDDDIKNLQEQINTIASSLEDLKAQVGSKGVTSVTVEGGKLIVVTDGQTVSYDLPAGTDMEEIEIKDGHLYVGGVDKGAVGGSNVTVNEDGVLLIDGKDAGLKVGTEVVIKDATNGIYTITIGDQTIQLPMASTNITVTNVGGYVFTCIGETDESEGIVWGKADASNDKWAGPKGPYVKDQLLVGQMNTVTVDVLPVTYDLGAQELKLVDSEGNEAPVIVKAQTTKADGPIHSDTRAANSQGEWDLSIEMDDDVTADNIGTAFATKVGNAYKNVKYALSVNGSLVTGYEYVIDTKEKEETSAYVLRWTDLYFGDTQVTTTSATVDLGETEFIIKNAKVYDYYIAIAEQDINDAAKIGVTVENNKITAPNTAAGEIIDFIVRAVDVNGNVVVPNGDATDTQLTVTFGKVEAGEDELTTTTYKAVPIASGKSAEIKINLEDVFSGLTASEAVAVDDISWSIDNDNFLLTKGAVADAKFTYLDANGDKIGDGTEAKVLDNVTNIKKVQSVKFTVAATDINNDVKPGKYTMTLKLTNSKTGDIRKVTVPVEITLPTFDELFAKVTSEDVWADGVGTLRLQNEMKLDYTIAFKPAGAAAFDTNFSIAFDKVKDKDVLKNITNGIVKLQNIVDKNALIENELGTVISYKINGKEGLTVKSDKFTTHVLTMFEGAKLVYYKNNTILDKAQAAYEGGKYVIDPMVVDATDKTKTGLAIQFGESEKAFVNTQITFNNVILNAIAPTLSKPTTNGVNRVYAVDGLGQGVIAGHDGDGVVIGGSYNGQSATLVVNCWDSNDIKTSFEIPFETVVK